MQLATCQLAAAGAGPPHGGTPPSRTQSTPAQWALWVASRQINSTRSTCCWLALQLACAAAGLACCRLLALLPACPAAQAGAVAYLQVLQDVVGGVDEEAGDHGIKAPRHLWPGVYLLHRGKGGAAAAAAA